MKKITFYNSFEAQKEAEIKATLSLTPTQRIVEVVALIRNVYRDELLKTKEPKKIIFLIKN